MKIATWNVNSINVRIPHLVAWLRRAEPDVVCLQETKCIDENFPEVVLEEAGYAAEYTGQKSYNGVAILSKKPMTDVQKNFPGDDDEAQKRMIAATIDGVRIVNTYVPNGSELWSDKFNYKLDWLQRLRAWFEETCDINGDVLLCGDFNVAMQNEDVWNVGAYRDRIHFSLPERAAMHYVKQFGLIDAFRQMNGDVKEFSWWDYRSGAWQKNQGLRIDHIWVSPSLAARCKSCVVDKSTRELEQPSDHAPVVAQFA